ncbi:hypothetical protein QUB70_10250 [Microcoleus sp. A003_D6]|uniref:hypothetical protein n=1 Tax=Microcoleus sp. A003_D6 TaxID=3055266 RepID=UPI002FD280AB
MPTNSMARPPARIANASKPTTKSNPDVFSIKLNHSPIKSNYRYLFIAECLPTMGNTRKKEGLNLQKILTSSLFPNHPLNQLNPLPNFLFSQFFLDRCDRFGRIWAHAGAESGNHFPLFAN